MALNNNPDYNEWMEIYKKLVFWELEMKKSDSPEMQEILQSQKSEANTEFFKFISKNYSSWVTDPSAPAPIMSHTLMKYKVFPHLEKDVPTFFVLIDNLRFDQWKVIQPLFSENFRIHEEETFYSILPTATQYSRNFLSNDINIIVYNFVDMMSHARTEMEVLKELASDEASYRSLTASWFEHSPLHQALKKVAGKKMNLIIATDHGSVRVNTPLKVIGDKQTTANLRYKHGRNLNYEPKEVLAFRDPRQAGLPVPNVNSSFIFAREDGYLCYPNNYNHFANYYKNSFQHGGVSLEEMIIPVIRMSSKV